MHNLLTNLIGWTAAVVGTCILLPQVIKSFKTKKTADLSRGMIVIYIVNSCLWITYGFFLSSLPLIISNGISFIICITQLVLKLKYDKNG